MDTINTIERIPLRGLVDVKAPIKRIGINSQDKTVLTSPVRLTLGSGVQIVIAADLLDMRMVLNGDGDGCK